MTEETGEEIMEIKRPEFPEEVLSRWDKAIMQGSGAEEVAKSDMPVLKKPKAMPHDIPKKPTPERVEYMRTAAEPRAGRIVEQLVKPAPPPAEHLLFEIVKKHTNPPLTEEQWGDVKGKPAQDILNNLEYAAIKQSITALQAANPAEDIAPIDGETMATYMGRLLPRPNA